MKLFSSSASLGHFTASQSTFWILPTLCCYSHMSHGRLSVYFVFSSPVIIQAFIFHPSVAPLCWVQCVYVTVWGGCFTVFPETQFQLTAPLLLLLQRVSYTMRREPVRLRVSCYLGCTSPVWLKPHLWAMCAVSWLKVWLASHSEGRASESFSSP